MKTYTTKGGKEINVIRDQGSPHLKIQFATGGQLPEELSGIFTSEVFAESAVESYLANQKNISEKKETKTKEK
tara:strand:+ start:452 stop:670 length:219 start_codon:yes stop_codon:yes gene_type:complete